MDTQLCSFTHMNLNHRNITYGLPHKWKLIPVYIRWKSTLISPVNYYVVRKTRMTHHLSHETLHIILNFFRYELRLHSLEKPVYNISLLIICLNSGLTVFPGRTSKFAFHFSCSAVKAQSSLNIYNLPSPPTRPQTRTGQHQLMFGCLDPEP